uniref:Uncharacterized protein n=1 Tax=Meloidogyne enterolobii TaxID=390850 RepID=A0A6V7V4H1_MELEN|nr:unnamed protein product [Meloidogyne enterolobii]
MNLAVTVNMIVDQLGIPCFLMIVYLTIRYKALHGTCHRLIGIYAICCVLAKIQIIPTWLVMITNIQIPLWLCALTDTLPIAGSFNIYSLMVMIAIDRILSMFFPIWYSVRKNSFHFRLMYGISTIFPLTFINLVIINVIKDPNRQSMCYLEELITQQGQTKFHNACLAFNLITLACYIVMIFKIKWDINKGKMNTVKVALFKSLSIIMGIQIGGWLFSLTAYNLVDKGYLNNLSEDKQTLICTAINCFSSLTSTCEVPAIFISSTEHRNALKKTFGINNLKYQTKNKNNILPNKQINPINFNPKIPKKF